MKMKTSLLAASAILAIGMTGCGTESSSTSTAPATVAKALDGYLLGANVCVDVPGNTTACDYSTTTNLIDGSYTIPSPYNVATNKVIITGGDDKDLIDANATDTKFHGALKSTANLKMATPLTTLLADGMTQTQITTMLGLPAATDLSKDYRATNNFDATLTKAAITVQAVIGQLTAVFSTDATLSKAAIMTSIVTNMATAFTSPADLKDANKLTTLVTAVDTNLASSVDTTNATTIKNTITNALAATITTAQATTTTYTEDTAKTATTTLSTATTTATAAVALEKSVTIANNTFTIGTTPAVFTQNGVFTAPVTPSSTTIGFTLENNGGELSTTAKTIDIAIVIDDANSSRELKAVLKGATVTDTGITVPAGAVLYVEGKASTGTAIAGLSLTNNVQDFKTVNGVTTFDLTNLMYRIAAQATGDYANITAAGTYNISFYIGGLTLGFDGTTVNALTAPKETVTLTNGQTATGTKFTATFVVN